MQAITYDRGIGVILNGESRGKWRGGFRGRCSSLVGRKRRPPGRSALAFLEFRVWRDKMEKIWLKSYPPGLTAEIARHVPPGARCSTAAPVLPTRCLIARHARLRPLDGRARLCGCCRRGPEKGDSVRLVMQTGAVPGALFGTRARLLVVNCNPLYTPRELEHQLKDSGATAIVIVENFAHTLEQVIAHTAIKHVVVTPMGEMLGALKGLLVNLVVRHVKKLVPAWKIPGAIASSRRWRPARASAAAVALDHDDFASCNHGGHRHFPGAMLTHGTSGHVSRHTLDQAMGLRPDSYQPPSALSHLRLPRTALPFLMIGARNLLIANPRTPVRQGIGPLPGDRGEAGSHSVHRCSTTRFESRFLDLNVRWAAAWRCMDRLPTVCRSDRQCSPSGLCLPETPAGT